MRALPCAPCSSPPCSSERQLRLPLRGPPRHNRLRPARPTPPRSPTAPPRRRPSSPRCRGQPRRRALLPLDHEARTQLNYVPMVRAGVPLEELTDPQKAQALSLLRSGLSESGFATARSIIAHEDILREIEKGAGRRQLHASPAGPLLHRGVRHAVERRLLGVALRGAPPLGERDARRQGRRHRRAALLRLQPGEGPVGAERWDCGSSRPKRTRRAP